jgi:hypothetical protein
VSDTVRPLLATNDESVLRTLLAPVTPETFVSEYWAKRPLYVKGDPQRYSGLLDMAAFERAVCDSGPIPAGALRVSFDKKTAAGRSAPAPSPTSPISTVALADAQRAFALFGEGATLCLSQMESRVPSLLPILAAVKRELGYPGTVRFSAYLSPPRSGYNWHFDARIACTLQLAGKKRWRYSSQPVTPWPQSNGTLFGDGTVRYAVGSEFTRTNTGLAPPDERDVSEALLEPGDLLVLPAGVWHEACSEDGISLALNLSFSRMTYGLLVQQLLDSLLSVDPDWRSAAPLLALTEPGAIATEGTAAVTAQLRRATALLNSLCGDSAAVVRLWESLVQSHGGSRDSVSSGDTAPVQRTQRLSVRSDGDFYAMLADSGSRLCVLVGASGELEFNGPSIPFVQRLLRERTFIAGDCVHWSNGEPFAWADVQVLLTELQRQGLILLEGSPRP